MIKRILIAVFLLILIVGGLVGFNLFRDKMISDVFANMPAQSYAVSTVEAQPESWQPTIEAIGTVNAAQGVDLTVESAGIVKEILFSSNQRIDAGQVLLQLDDTAQRADVQAARTQYELERSNLERATELRQRGVTATSNLETTEAAARAAEAQLARAEAVLEQRKLVAPFSGTIGLPRIDLGQYVSPGTSVATLQDLDNMRVDFSLPEGRLPELSVGQTLTVRSDGMDISQKGEVTGIDPRVDAASRMVALRGQISNAADAFTPGLFVRIEVEQKVEEGIIALPQTSVITSLYGDHVYVVRPSEDNAEQLVAMQVFVQTGRRNEGQIEIKSGVKAGDQVVTAGQNRLSNGGPVTIDNSVQPGGPVEAAAKEPAATPPADQATPPTGAGKAAAGEAREPAATPDTSPEQDSGADAAAPEDEAVTQ